MVELFLEYGLFLAKVTTVVVATIIIIGFIVSASIRSGDRPGQGRIKVKHFNSALDESKQQMKAFLFQGEKLKQEQKEAKKKHKIEKKEEKKQARKDKKENHVSEKGKVYVLDFDGDVRASQVHALRREITAILSMACENDEVVIRLESPGGVVHGYGLASSQLLRVKNKNIPLTICVDKVAASGGYMMACIGDKIISAPFAIVGSIGVIAQIPNFNRLLKEKNIDLELHTAGAFKRTLTVFGENTDEGRQKFREELEDTHVLFKEFVSENRPVVNIDTVATGEHWFGKRALESHLVDELKTSDEYLLERTEDADVYMLKYSEKKSIADRVGMTAQAALENVLIKFLATYNKTFL